MKRFFVIVFLRGNYVCPPLLCLKIKSFLLVICLVLCGFGDVGWMNGQEQICGTDMVKQLLLNEGSNLQSQINTINQNWKQYNIAKGGQSQVFPVNTIPITIPTVVHVMHDNNPGMITKDEIITAIDVVNINFRNESGLPGSGIGVNLFVELKLANRDEGGQCTDGIIYVNTPNALGLLGPDKPFKAQSRWDNTKYLNIYVTQCIIETGGGLCTPPTPNAAGFIDASVHGFAYTPDAFQYSDFSEFDGIEVMAPFLQRENALRPQWIVKEVLTHEVGHYIGLQHTFDGTVADEATPCDDPADCLTEGDCICDTNPHRKTLFIGPDGLGGCSAADTKCIPVAEAPVWNYMSSSHCRSEFTPNQRDRIHWMMQNIPPRVTLVSNQSLTDAGLAVASATEPIICNNESTTLSVTAGSTDIIEWTVSKGDNLSLNNVNTTNKDITVSPNETTTYLVTINSGDDCFFDFDEITIIVNPLPILAQTEFNMCDGQPIAIDLNQDLIDSGFEDFDYTYRWNINGEEIEGGQQTINQPGMYEVTIIAHYENPETECINMQMIEVLPILGFTATLSVDPSGTTFCQMVNISTTVSPLGDYTYEWSNDRTTESVGFGDLAAGGSQTISVIITDVNTQCTETLSQTLTFQTNVPQPVVQNATLPTECGQILWISNASDYSQLQWYVDENPIVGESGSSYTAKEEGTYYVVGVGNGVGCENQSADVVLSYEDLEPSFASPNDSDFTLAPSGTTTTWGGIGGSVLPQEPLKL